VEMNSNIPNYDGDYYRDLRVLERYWAGKDIIGIGREKFKKAKL